MSFESSGAEYLRRLKRDQEGVEAYQPPTAPAAPVTPTATGRDASEGPERRENPRYKCEGSATFRVQGSTVRSWGTFTDLSSSGCYVELKATFPTGALIDLELELNGMRAQVTGEVRVSYPFLGMGVAFRNLNPENRQQLAAMIESLRPSLQRVVAQETMSSAAPVSLPIILNPGAALQALADYFEKHAMLSKEEFVHLLRRSQGL
jgi:hypothetical protein